MSDLPYKADIPQELLDDIRMYYGDLPEFNNIIEGVEVSDEKLRLAVQLWIQHFNFSAPILQRKYTVEDFPAHMTLFHGVVIELLKMSGMIQSRNFLNFNDNGVSFTVNDKAADYMQWIQNYLQTHAEDVKNLKVALNAESAYDFIASPEAWYSDLYY